MNPADKKKIAAQLRAAASKIEAATHKLEAGNGLSTSEMVEEIARVLGNLANDSAFWKKQFQMDVASKVKKGDFSYFREGTEASVRKQLSKTVKLLHDLERAYDRAASSL